MVAGMKWVLASKFDGFPKESDLELEDDPIPEQLQENECLFEAVWLTVDPYMRMGGFLGDVGDPMIGQQIAKVSASRREEFKEGQLYLANFGWRTHTVLAGDDSPEKYKISPLPDLDDLPTSLALGTVGMPGATAYISLMKFGRPKSGETVLVTAAAGSVGSTFGQLAKLEGCTVIGLTSTDEKCQYLTDDLGFDLAINYKEGDICGQLEKLAPDGIDICLDCVGGQFTPDIINNSMRQGGRIICISSISRSNAPAGDAPIAVPDVMFTVMAKCLCIQGFAIFTRPYSEWEDAFAHLVPLISEGKLKSPEHIVEGFEKMQATFYGLFRSENIGKALIKITT